MVTIVPLQGVKQDGDAPPRTAVSLRHSKTHTNTTTRGKDEIHDSTAGSVIKATHKSQTPPYVEVQIVELGEVAIKHGNSMMK
jgi:hypothetical protein